MDGPAPRRSRQGCEPLRREPHPSVGHWNESLVQGGLEGFACMAGVRGETERAARLWGAAQALHETKGIPRDPDFLAEADARISAVRTGMGEEEWEEAWRKGTAMTLEEAVSYALEGEEEASG